MSDGLGVAVVGVGAGQWSGIAHIPALRSTEGVRLVRLVTSNPESARNASDLWNVPASSDLDTALSDDSVDLVTITVRAARHAEIARKAIAAGKHVYCEWPLGIDASEARELAELSATRPGRLHAVGLQGRLSPGVTAAAAFIRSGAMGRPLAAGVKVLLPQGLHARPRHRAHLRHRTSAASVLTIQGGHAIDMLTTMLGRPARPVASVTWTAVDHFTVLETGEQLARDAPDNAIVILDLGGVPVSMQLSQTAAATDVSMQILGTQGQVTLVAPDQPQMSRPEVSFTPLSGPRKALGADEAIPGIALPPTHPGYQVAIAYTTFARAVRDGSAASKDRGEARDLALFSDAVILHDLLDELTKQSETSLYPIGSAAT
jgi:predicted dehydrogenase